MSYAPLTDALPILAARLPQVVREREILRIAGSLGGKDASGPPSRLDGKP
jgi:hypothetical protein